MEGTAIQEPTDRDETNSGGRDREKEGSTPPETRATVQYPGLNTWGGIS